MMHEPTVLLWLIYACLLSQAGAGWKTFVLTFLIVKTHWGNLSKIFCWLILKIKKGTSNETR